MVYRNDKRSKRRVQEHKAGSNKSTSYRGVFELMYYEAYRNKMDALGREKFLKSGAGRRFVKKQVRHYLEETENVTTE